MKTKRGILGLFLALCVVWSMLPLGAFAADENAGDGKTHISTAEDLRAINGNLAGHYVLDGDIDLTDCLGGGSWTPIGTEDKPFTGTFDGNGHSIKGLYINASDSNYQGLFGYVDSGTVKNLTVSGSVSGTGDYVGSVVGYNNGGTVKNCYNTGEVSGDVSAGGVVGSSGGIVENCYNTGKVNGDVSAGGVVGQNSGISTVENCYNTGTVSGGSYVGGVVGQNVSGTVENCCYLEGTADEDIGDGSYTGNGAQPLTEENFANEGNFTDWDFDSTWEMSALLGRPILRSNQEGGSGTPASPYEIPDLATLERARNLINADTEGTTYRSASYVLTDDIDMSKEYGEDEKAWTPIGTNFSKAFTGTFDGQGHSIKGLYINSNFANQGLFGYIGSGGTVENLTVSGTVSVIGNSYVGGVVGWNNGGTIENCHNTVAVSGSGTDIRIGGVVGWNDKGTVKNCSNTGKVSGEGSVGGVVGENSGIGTVANCYNTGEVSGDDNPAGGVVGENGGTVENCSNTGKVSGTGGMQAPAGGVVGQNRGTVENCSNTGKVSGSGSGGSAGGVVGWNSGSGTITNCYNTGSVSESWYIGGVVGSNYGGVTNCYNTGSVSGSSLIGGVVGWNANGTVANCYYEEGKAGSGGTTGAELKTSDQFASGEVAWLLQDGQDSDIWGQTLTGGTPDLYPVLKAFDSDAPQVFKVTFMNGENEFAAAYANSGGKVSAPNPAPTNVGHQFVGWYSDNTAWDFNTEVTEDLTLTASWRQLSSDASVTSVTVKDTSGKVSGTEITVTLPAGSSLPTDADEITIEVAAGATYGDTLTTSDGGATWTFTVTAEDGTTTVTYTIQITVEQPAPDPEPETPVTPPAPPSGGGPSNPTYRPDIGTTENGEVDVSTTRPHAGDTVTVTPKPDDGYDVQTVTVTDEDGETVPVTKNEDGSFTFTQPAGEVTIDVAFTPHVSSSIEIQNGASVAIASPDDVIEIPQSSTFTVHFTSEKPLSDFAFLAGNGKAIATDTVAAWNPETREGTYTLYGLGAPGSAHDTTGIYVNGVKLFTMKVVPRPLTSDTTVDFSMQVGGTYQFWVKPDDPSASYTFNTANGNMLQTSIVKGAYPDSQGRYLCRLTVTGRGDTVGVYCNIDGNTYKLFTVNCQ